MATLIVGCDDHVAILMVVLQETLAPLHHRVPEWQGGQLPFPFGELE